MLQSLATLNAKRFTLASQTWSLEPGYIGVRNHGAADQMPLPAFADDRGRHLGGVSPG